MKPADVANWTKQIEAAVGYNKARGDVVQVTAMPFSADAAKAAKAELKAGQSAAPNPMNNMIRTIVTLAIIALVLFFAWRSIKRAEANRVPLRVPLDLRELEAADTRALEAAGAAAPRLAGAERAGARTGGGGGPRRRAHGSDRDPARRSGADASFVAR